MHTHSSRRVARSPAPSRHRVAAQALDGRIERFQCESGAPPDQRQLLPPQRVRRHLPHAPNMSLPPSAPPRVTHVKDPEVDSESVPLQDRPPPKWTESTWSTWV